MKLAKCAGVLAIALSGVGSAAGRAVELESNMHGDPLPLPRAAKAVQTRAGLWAMPLVFRSQRLTQILPSANAIPEAKTSANRRAAFKVVERPWAC